MDIICDENYIKYKEVFSGDVILLHFGSDITLADLQGITTITLTRSAATLLRASYQDTDDGETENMVGNADRAVKDNICTLDQPFDIYPSPEDVSIDKLDSHIPLLLLILLKNTLGMGRTSRTSMSKHVQLDKSAVLSEPNDDLASGLV